LEIHGLSVGGARMFRKESVPRRSPIFGSESIVGHSIRSDGPTEAVPPTKYARGAVTDDPRFAREKACKVVAWLSHTLDATTAQPCNDFAVLGANPYSDSTKVVATLRSNGEHDLATRPPRLQPLQRKALRLSVAMNPLLVK
jgi:hypothetical protein